MFYVTKNVEYRENCENIKITSKAQFEKLRDALDFFEDSIRDYNNDNRHTIIELKNENGVIDQYNNLDTNYSDYLDY